jgi:hypothetical protein
MGKVLYTVLSASKNSIIDRAEGCYEQDLSQTLVNEQLEEAVRLLSEKGWKVKTSRQSEDGRKVTIMEKDATPQTPVSIKFVARRGRVVEQYFIPDHHIAHPIGMEESMLQHRLLRGGWIQDRVEMSEAGHINTYFFTWPS